VADYQFFLSYARVDSDDPFLERFFTDLAGRVRSKVPLSSQVALDDVGFIDRSAIDVGQSWGHRLVDGLRAARTFVPVLTRAYVNSEGCGRELAVFLDRQQQIEPGGAAHILPVMWEQPRRLTMPSVLEPFQLDHKALGTMYAERGLAYLARRSPREPAYADFVDEFAMKLVAAAATPPPAPRGALTWASLASAFATGAPAPRGDDDDHGLPTARCAFVAARRDELIAVRGDTTAYGGQAQAWRPFAPDATAIRILAQRAATREDLVFETLEVDGTLVERVRAAEADGEFVVVVVDPWTVRLRAYRDHLDTFDRNQFVNVGILAPINVEDPENMAEPDALRGEVRSALSRTFLVNPAVVRDAIGTAEDFEREFVAVVADARRRMAQLRAVSAWPGDEPHAMPIVSGTGAS
jgi:FxsC-like protein